MAYEAPSLDAPAQHPRPRGPHGSSQQPSPQEGPEEALRRPGRPRSGLRMPKVVLAGQAFPESRLTRMGVGRCPTEVRGERRGEQQPGEGTEGRGGRTVWLRGQVSGSPAWSPLHTHLHHTSLYLATVNPGKPKPNCGVTNCVSCPPARGLASVGRAQPPPLGARTDTPGGLPAPRPTAERQTLPTPPPRTHTPPCWTASAAMRATDQRQLCVSPAGRRGRGALDH